MKKGKGKIIFWVAFAGLAVTGLVILARKAKGTNPDKRADMADELARTNPTSENIAAANEARRDASLASQTAADAFPLKRGSRDVNKTYVRDLQLWLQKKFGSAVLPRYGADGIFGSETENALRKNALPVVVAAGWFNANVLQQIPRIGF